MTLDGQHRPRCFLDFSVNGNLVGRVIFELYADLCPITCENFRALCTGEKGAGKVTGKPLHYKDTPIHRIVKDFIIQGGDFSAGNGTGGESIYGGTFKDEDLELKHDQPFLLSMANRGKDTNGSQFFITTKPAPHLDSLHVVFGRVVSGEDIVANVESMKTDGNSKPVADVRISSCGELVLRLKSKESKKAKKKKEVADSSKSDDSGDSESEAKKHKKRKKKQKKKKSKKKSKKENDEPVIKEEVVESEFVSSIKPAEIPEVPSNSFLLRRSPVKTEEKKTNGLKNVAGGPLRRQLTSESRVQISRSGRKIRGRGTMRYRTPSRSRSRSTTPPHWRMENQRLEALRMQNAGPNRWVRGRFEERQLGNRNQRNDRISPGKWETGKIMEDPDEKRQRRERHEVDRNKERNNRERVDRKQDRGVLRDNRADNQRYKSKIERKERVIEKSPERGKRDRRNIKISPIRIPPSRSPVRKRGRSQSESPHRSTGRRARQSPERGRVRNKSQHSIQARNKSGSPNQSRDRRGSRRSPDISKTASRQRSPVVKMLPVGKTVVSKERMISCIASPEQKRTRHATSSNERTNRRSPMRSTDKSIDQRKKRQSSPDPTRKESPRRGPPSRRGRSPIRSKGRGHKKSPSRSSSDSDGRDDSRDRRARIVSQMQRNDPQLRKSSGNRVPHRARSNSSSGRSSIEPVSNAKKHRRASTDSQSSEPLMGSQTEQGVRMEEDRGLQREEDRSESDMEARREEEDPYSAEAWSKNQKAKSGLSAKETFQWKPLIDEQEDEEMSPLYPKESPEKVNEERDLIELVAKAREEYKKLEEEEMRGKERVVEVMEPSEIIGSASKGQGNSPSPLRIVQQVTSEVLKSIEFEDEKSVSPQKKPQSKVTPKSTEGHESRKKSPHSRSRDSSSSSSSSRERSRRRRRRSSSSDNNRQRRLSPKRRSPPRRRTPPRRRSPARRRSPRRSPIRRRSPVRRSPVRRSRSRSRSRGHDSRRSPRRRSRSPRRRSRSPRRRSRSPRRRTRSPRRRSRSPYRRRNSPSSRRSRRSRSRSRTPLRRRRSPARGRGRRRSASSSSRSSSRSSRSRSYSSHSRSRSSSSRSSSD